MPPSRICTLQFTPLLFWLMFHVGYASESEKRLPERAMADTSTPHAPTNVTADSLPEEIMNDIELLSDLDILMDLEFLELLEMLETENLTLTGTMQEETHGDSTGRN
jgi:hypothetical protein